MSSAAAAKLRASSAGSTAHLRTICEFSLNRPPLRAKVDRQSYEELKPGVERAFAMVEWFDELLLNFSSLLTQLAQAGGVPAPEHLSPLMEAVDVCVVLENQFAGWSACINRFSWFKRTFSQLARDLADDPAAQHITKNLPRFQSFIGSAEL